MSLFSAERQLRTVSLRKLCPALALGDHVLAIKAFNSLFQTPAGDAAAYAVAQRQQYLSPV